MSPDAPEGTGENRLLKRVLAWMKTLVTGQPDDTKEAPKEEATAAPPERNEAKEEAKAEIAQARTMLTWTVGAFAAVATVILAGTTVSDIGEAEGWRLRWGLGGAALALIAAAGIIAFCASALVSGFVGLPTIAGKSKLAEWIEKNSTFLQQLGQPEITTVKQLDAFVTDQFVEQSRAYAQMGEIEARNTGAPLPKAEQARFDAAKVRYQEARNNLLYTYPTVNGVVWTGRWRAVQRKIEHSLQAIVVGAGLAAIGIVTFVWAANPQEPKETETLERPAAVLVTFTEDGLHNARVQLGDDCAAVADIKDDTPQIPLEAVAVGVAEDSISVVTVPTPSCRASELTLSSKEANWVANEDVLDIAASND